MRIFLTLCLCVKILTFSNRLLLVCGHELWHDDLYYRRYDHQHGKYSDSELMVDVINNLGLNILMVQNKDNDNNIAFSPYGAAVILIALGEGLQGEALYEIRKTLQLPYDGHTIRVGLRDIHRHLKSYFIPREGFLAGITLNSENVSIKSKYIDLLRFYGYDINSFNTALYPETHMTTEMTTMAGREETTIATGNTIESTTSTKVSGEETTTNVDANEETTTLIKTTTSELQTTVSTTSQKETTYLSTQQPTSTTEEVKTSITTAKPVLAQSSTEANPEKITTSKFPHTTSSLPQPDNLVTTTTSITSTLSDISTTLKQTTYSNLENIVTSTIDNSDVVSSTTFQQINDMNKEIETIATINEASVSTTLLTFTEVTTPLPQQTTNADVQNIFMSTTENSDVASSTTFQKINDMNSEIETIATINEASVSTTLLTFTEVTTPLPQQTTNADVQNIFMSTTENSDVASSTTFQKINDMNSEIETIATINEASVSTTLLTFTEVTPLPQQTTNADVQNIFMSTTENVAITSQFEQITNNSSEFITKPITTSIPTTYETTVSTQQFTDPVTSTTENYEKTTSRIQQSTKKVLDSITTPITNAQETSDIPTSVVFVDSTEIEASTEELVTQPSSSEAGTVEAFSIENTNNITLVVNNQTIFVTRPSGKATNISVNIRTSTVSSGDDLITDESIQSRNIRSVKSDKIDYLSNEDYKNIFKSNKNNSFSNEEKTSENKMNDNKRYSLIEHETNSFDENLNGQDFMADFFSATPHTKIKKEYINSERTGKYQKIFHKHKYDNGVKGVLYGEQFNGKYIEQTTTANNQLDICNNEIQINNTIYIADNQYNLNSKIPENLNQLTRAKLTHEYFQQIRNPRSVNDYIMARQYDQPHYFRPTKPYLPQEPPYFLVDGNKESNLDFMTYDTVLPFLRIQHLGALALAFPLDSDKYYLLLLLPTRNNGLDELVCNIRNQNIFKYIINNLQLTHVKATIPSFNLKGRITLTNTLQKLGIRKIFQPRQADFTPMTDDENIYVTNIEQAVSVTIKNYMNFHNSHRYGSHHYYTDPVRFEVHGPFLYFVIDSEQQVLLMAGKVVNPLNIRIK